jgi:hypothetical protein
LLRLCPIASTFAGDALDILLSDILPSSLVYRLLQLSQVDGGGASHAVPARLQVQLLAELLRYSEANRAHAADRWLQALFRCDAGM